MHQIRISAKNLGDVAHPDFCPRCFWVKLHAKKLPYQIFPGIFSSIDSYTRLYMRGHLERHQQLPAWLQGLGNVQSVYEGSLHYSKFNILDDTTNILLTGTPDEIFMLGNSEYIIVDYKTARYTGAQDRLYKIYETQLNGYAWIGQQRGIRPITGLSLVYMELITNEDALVHGGNLREGGFAMGFSAFIHPVTLDLTLIPPLLEKTREIFDMPVAPACREGCKDCEQVESLIALLNGGHPYDQ
ncbi:MAG: PD-(D/E)XK nuclease family protein [Anaerolineales bacterium]|nr:PD-(D/E)XK nuclease family protein [Anaerolineales bacterium]